MEKKTAYASFEIELWTDCPHCSEYFDIMDMVDHEALPGPLERAQGLDIEVICPECKQEFIVNETRY